MRPRVIILSGYGLNCEEETRTAFEFVGAEAAIIHVNDLIARPSVFKDAEILAVPGGFSYGDDTGSGKAYASRLNEHLKRSIEGFLERDTLAIGICNGFQILTSGGLLPGALIANDSGKFLCRWVDLAVAGKSPWLTGIESLSLPIAHGEGKYVTDGKTIQALVSDDAIALRYEKGPLCEYLGLATNPNGAFDDIAGVTARGGRVLGMMPHPERAIRFTQLPHWTHEREKYVRSGTPVPTEGPGITLFRNAVNYFA